MLHLTRNLRKLSCQVLVPFVHSRDSELNELDYGFSMILSICHNIVYGRNRKMMLVNKAGIIQLSGADGQ